MTDTKTYASTDRNIWCFTSGKMYEVCHEFPDGDFYIFDDDGDEHRTAWSNNWTRHIITPSEAKAHNDKLDPDLEKVVSLVTERDVEAGMLYVVVRFIMDNAVVIRDLAGDDYTLLNGEWEYPDNTKRQAIEKAIAEPGVSDTPKTFGETTPEEIRALANNIRSHLDISENHEAGLIPMGTRAFLQGIADGLKPAEPVMREEWFMVHCYGGDAPAFLDRTMANPTHKLCFTTVDGKPVLGSIKMEEIEEPTK